MKIVLGCIVETISTRVDGSLKLAFGTQEIASDDAGRLIQLRGKYVKVLLSDTNVTTIEAELVDQESITGEKKTKSKSQRLRNCIWRLWEHEGKPGEFDTFYDSYMETIITQVKESL